MNRGTCCRSDLSQVPASQAEKHFVTKNGLRAQTLEIDYVNQIKLFLKWFLEFPFGANP